MPALSELHSAINELEMTLSRLEYAKSLLIKMCEHYEFDGESCEEYCHSRKVIGEERWQQGLRGVSLEPGSEHFCPLCEYWEVKKECPEKSIISSASPV